MERNLVLGMMIAVLTLLSGCSSIATMSQKSCCFQHHQEKKLLCRDNPVQSAPVNNAFIGGRVAQEQMMPIPENGLSLLNALLQAGIAHLDRGVRGPNAEDPIAVDTVAEGSDESLSDSYIVSLRRETTIGHQTYYVPLKLVQYGSAGDLGVRDGDIVRVLNTDDLGLLDGAISEGQKFSVTGLVESPDIYTSKGTGGEKLKDMESITKFQTTADGIQIPNVVTITRRPELEIGISDHFIFPIDDAGEIPIIADDVIHYSRLEAVPLFTSSLVSKIRRSTSKQQETANRFQRFVAEQREFENSNPSITDRFQAVIQLPQRLLR